jgi:DNA-binding response OmpR family regulator
MKYGQAHTPVILLLENGTSPDGEFIRQWLSDSRFMTCEAYDAFEALEEISDFTVRNRPDVIILNVDSSENDLSSIREIVKCGSDDQDLAIISMTDDSPRPGKDDFYAPNVRQVAARLEKLLPHADVMSN